MTTVGTCGGVRIRSFALPLPGGGSGVSGLPLERRRDRWLGVANQNGAPSEMPAIVTERAHRPPVRSHSPRAARLGHASPSGCPPCPPCRRRRQRRRGVAAQSAGRRRLGDLRLRLCHHGGPDGVVLPHPFAHGQRVGIECDHHRDAITSSCVLRLYQPETRAIVSSNHASRFVRSFPTSPSACVTSGWRRRPGPVGRSPTVWSSAVNTAPLSAAGAGVSSTTSANVLGEMYQGPFVRSNAARWRSVGDTNVGNGRLCASASGCAGDAAGIGVVGGPVR